MLYPVTPIVKDILIRALWDAKLGHRLERDMVCLDPAITDDQLAAGIKPRLSEFEMRDIRITRSRNAEMMNASSLASWMNQSDTSWFDRALEANCFTSHFQPIVNYRGGGVHGHECLIRLQMERPYSGGEIINAAVSRGRIHVFDSYTRQLSVRLAGAQHTPGSKVFINFMPSSIYDPAFCMKSTLDAMSRTDLTPEDIVFEVVESEAITDVNHLKKICAYYREHGFSFALDDVGTGSNSLQMVCDLQPHYMKIDKSLISGIGNPMYRSAIQKLVDLGNEFGARVIAEGIETRESAEVCLNLGIELMQGYYFAKPSPSMITTASQLRNLARQVGSSLTVIGEPSLAAATLR